MPQAHVHLYCGLFFLLGFFISGINLIYSTVRELNTRDVAATALAFTNIGGFLMVSVLQPLFGWILDLNDGPGVGRSASGLGYSYAGYHAVLVVIVALSAISVVAYSLTDKKRDVCRHASADV